MVPPRAPSFAHLAAGRTFAAPGEARLRSIADTLVHASETKETP